MFCFNVFVLVSCSLTVLWVCFEVLKVCNRSGMKKKFRTKIMQEQKDKMRAFANKRKMKVQLQVVLLLML